MEKEIVLSKYCDFCNGVKRTINICNSELDKHDKLYSIGQVIHNPLVIEKLEEKGLKVVGDISHIPSGENLLIRSHGISPLIIERAKKRNIKLIDAACPFVKNIQKICSTLKKEGYFIIITGDIEHPEVKALESIAGEESLIVSTPEGDISLPEKVKKLGVVTQSTYNKNNFYIIINKILTLDKEEVRSFNTICEDSIDRRKDVKKIASKVDINIIIGGKSSSNTTQLYQISKGINYNSFHIENPKSISQKLKNKIKKVEKVGIIGGASTPKWIIDNFLQEV